MACSPELQKRLTVTPGVVTGKPGAQRRDARDVVALRAVRLTAAEDDVFDLRGIELRRLAEHVPDGVPGEIVGAGEVERSAAGLGQRRAAAGDDDGFAHERIIRRPHRLRATSLRVTGSGTIRPVARA